MSHLLNFVLQILATVRGQGEKWIRTGNKDTKLSLFIDDLHRKSKRINTQSIRTNQSSFNKVAAPNIFLNKLVTGKFDNNYLKVI